MVWQQAERGQQPPGHLWRWDLERAGASSTRVTCTYDWTRLTDESRLPRARATTPDKLRASLDRLAALAESPRPSTADQQMPRGGPPASVPSGWPGAGRGRRGFTAVPLTGCPGSLICSLTANLAALYPVITFPLEPQRA